VELPVEIEEKAVNAEYKNGLLLIRLPKAAKSQAQAN
jgi:HSP20 family molecular chaperone IbpA